jgi:hypothetical protein
VGSARKEIALMKRLVLIFALAAIAAIFVVGAGSVAAATNPHYIPVTYTCEGGEQVTLLTDPEHGIKAKHEVDDTSIWESMAGTRTITNLETGEVIELHGEVPGQVKHNDLVRCTSTYTWEGFLVEETLFFLVTPQSGQD